MLFPFNNFYLITSLSFSLSLSLYVLLYFSYFYSPSLNVLSLFFKKISIYPSLFLSHLPSSLYFFLFKHKPLSFYLVILSILLSSSSKFYLFFYLVLLSIFLSSFSIYLSI